MYNKIRQLTAGVQEDVIAFAQKIIRTPSTSGNEKAMADACMEEMVKLGYDEVFRDGAGNIIGVLKGTGGGRNLMFNSHMDHVDAGDINNWQYQPYEAVIDGGYIHGRAASDVKGGTASQIYAGAVLKQLGGLKGDVIYTGVVQEEPAEGFGIQYLCQNTLKEKNLHFDVMISSEATSMNLFLGHRGRAELEVTVYGRTAHGGSPWRGINAVDKAVPVLAGIQKINESLPEHDFLGKATLALTNIACSPGRLSIIPDVCTLYLDRRLLPGETVQHAIGPIQELIDHLSTGDPEFKAQIQVRKSRSTSYTGYTAELEKLIAAWSVAPDNEYVQACGTALAAIGQQPGFGKWDFATDASFVTSVMGIPTIGYSPMEEQYAHTPVDRVSIEKIIAAVAGNAAIACEICNMPAKI